MFHKMCKEDHQVPSAFGVSDEWVGLSPEGKRDKIPADPKIKTVSTQGHKRLVPRVRATALNYCLGDMENGKHLLGFSSKQAKAARI